MSCSHYIMSCRHCIMPYSQRTMSAIHHVTPTTFMSCLANIAPRHAVTTSRHADTLLLGGSCGSISLLATDGGMQSDGRTPLPLPLLSSVQLPGNAPATSLASWSTVLGACWGGARVSCLPYSCLGTCRPPAWPPGARYSGLSEGLKGRHVFHAASFPGMCSPSTWPLGARYSGLIQGCHVWHFNAEGYAINCQFGTRNVRIVSSIVSLGLEM